MKMLQWKTLLNVKTLLVIIGLALLSLWATGSFADNIPVTVSAGGASTTIQVAELNKGTAKEILDNYYKRNPYAKAQAPTDKASSALLGAVTSFMLPTQIGGSTDLLIPVEAGKNLKQSASRFCGMPVPPMKIMAYMPVTTVGYYVQPPCPALDSPCAYRDLELFKNTLTTFGMPLSDSQFQIIDRENKQRFIELLFNPERFIWLATNTMQMQGSAISNSLAGVGDGTFRAAFNNIVHGLGGGGSGGGSISASGNALLNVANENAADSNYASSPKTISKAVYMVQQMYKFVFIPMAILLLLPGAVITQVKGFVSQGFGLSGEDSSSPWEGMLRALIAIFLIPSTQLIISYATDIGNSMALSVVPWIEQKQIFSWANDQFYNVPVGNAENAIMPPTSAGTTVSGKVIAGAAGVVSSGGALNFQLSNPFSSIGNAASSLGSINSILNTNIANPINNAVQGFTAPGNAALGGVTGAGGGMTGGLNGLSGGITGKVGGALGGLTGGVNIGADGVTGKLGVLANVGSLGSMGNLANVGSLGSMGNLANVGNLGSLGNLANVGNLGSLGSLGSLGNIGNLGNLGFLGSLGNIGSVIGGFTGEANFNSVQEGQGGEGKPANQGKQQVAEERQLWLSEIMQLVFNLVELILSYMVVVLTTYQLVMMCYLLLLGPIAACFFAWPTGVGSLFRHVFSGWLNGVVVLSLWRFYWCVILAVASQRIYWLSQNGGFNSKNEFEMMVFVCFLGMLLVIPFQPFVFDPGSVAFQVLEKGGKAAQDMGSALKGAAKEAGLPAAQQQQIGQMADSFSNAGKVVEKQVGNVMGDDVSRQYEAKEGKAGNAGSPPDSSKDSQHPGQSQQSSSSGGSSTPGAAVVPPPAAASVPGGGTAPAASGGGNSAPDAGGGGSSGGGATPPSNPAAASVQAAVPPQTPVVPATATGTVPLTPPAGAGGSTGSATPAVVLNTSNSTTAANAVPSILPQVASGGGGASPVPSSGSGGAPSGSPSASAPSAPASPSAGSLPPPPPAGPSMPSGPGKGQSPPPPA